MFLIQMKNKKINWYVYGIILGFFLIANIFWYFSDAVSNWAMTANPILVTIVNFCVSPFYIGSLILFIELFFRGYKLKRNAINYARIIIASIILSLALDIWTIPHSILIDYTLPNSPQVSIYFDTIFGKFLAPTLQSMGKLGTYIFYVILSTVMVIISMIIASPAKFFGLVKKEFGG